MRPSVANIHVYLVSPVTEKRLHTFHLVHVPLLLLGHPSRQRKPPQAQQLVVKASGKNSLFSTTLVTPGLHITTVIHTLVLLEPREDMDTPFTALDILFDLDDAGAGMHAAG